MLRYLKILRLFWAASLAAEMEYRANFLVAALTSSASLAGSLFTLRLFYRAHYLPGGWTWEQALLVMGLFTLFDGFSATCLAPNLSRIVGHVQQGTMDFILLKPVDSQFWLSTRNLSPWGLPNVLLGLVTVLYAGMREGLHPGAYAVGLAPLLLAGVLLYSLWFIVAATTIWFVKVYNATEVLRNLMEAGRYPVDAYPRLPQFIFTFVVPVAFLTTVPARTMLGKGSEQWQWLLGAAALALGAFIVARLFWKFALRHYTSASS